MLTVFIRSVLLVCLAVCALRLMGKRHVGQLQPFELVIAIMIVLSVVYDSVVMVDISIVYAALSFVGTLFIARFIEGGM